MPINGTEYPENRAQQGQLKGRSKLRPCWQRYLQKGMAMKRANTYLYLFIFGVLISPLSLHAGWTDGNSLLKALEGQDKDDLGYRSGYFDGYVKGVADLSVDVFWCPPHNVKGGQLPKIAAIYLRAHPESLHKGADTLVVEALKEPFPCEK